MTVFLPKDCRTYRYDFWWKGKRQLGSTGQTSEEGAEQFEANLRGRLQREFEEAELRRASGIEILSPDESPFITDWAGEYMDHVEQLAAKGKISAPERIEGLLRVVLRFWGAKPSADNTENPPREGEPYHDLRLIDPIREPDWLTRFEEWMDARRVDGRPLSGQTKNQYRSVMSQLYTHAMQPRSRKLTGVQVNPFAGIYRDDTTTREVTITPDDLRRLLEHASYHVRLATAIGGLAPKLRLSNILQLTWSGSFDEGMRFITVRRHKTVGKTGRPLVMPVSAQLRTILEDAKARAPRGRKRGEDYVVTYRSRPIKSLRAGIRAAAEAAGLTYGRFVEDGLTFHTLRHTAATIMAELDVAEGKRKSVMGHERLETTQKYTHLRPVHEIEPVEQLSRALPLVDVVTKPGRRASRKGAAKPAGLGKKRASLSDANRRSVTPSAKGQRSA